MSEVRWLDDDEERAWRAVQFMGMRLTARLASELAATSELSYPDYLVLVALGDRPDGRLRIFELGTTLGWEKSRVSHQVARMAERGLVTKQRCRDDGRGADVVVTKRGRRAMVVAAPHHLATVRRLFIDRLTADELAAVGAVAEKILDGLADG